MDFPADPHERRRHSALGRLAWIPALLAIVLSIAAMIQSSRPRNDDDMQVDATAHFHLRVHQAAARAGDLTVVASARDIAPLTDVPTTDAARRAHAYVVFRVDDGRVDRSARVDDNALDAWFIGEHFEQQLAHEGSTLDGAAPVSPGDVSTSPDWSLTYHDVPAGRHTVEAWLVRADHTVLAHEQEVDVDVR